MAFDLGAFVSTLAGGALALIGAKWLMEKTGRAVKEERVTALEKSIRDLEEDVRLLKEQVRKLVGDVEALKLDVAQLHDALHKVLVNDKRSEMEDWD